METDLMRDILEKYGARPDMKLWRCNTGAGVGMSFIQQAKRLGYIPDNLPVVKYGVPGQADIQGILKGGKHISIETKCKTKQTTEQKRWQDMVESMNGIYILARHISDVEEIIP
jgi:hypothetical protein